MKWPHHAQADRHAAPVQTALTDVDRLLLVGTGSITSALLPFWLGWFTECCPALDVRIVLTRSACRFVVPEALEAIARRPVIVDEWPAGSSSALHVELAEWADVALVYPASLNFLSRFALGMGDSPSLLALHAMTGTIAVAPALPPGTVEGRAVRLHLDALRGDPRVVVAPTVMGRSVSNGAVSGGSVLPLPAVVELIGRHRKEMAA